MALFNKKKKDVTLKVYKSNQETHMLSDTQTDVYNETKKEQASEEGLWERCPSCAHILYADDLQNDLNVCSACGYHFRLNARQRIRLTADEGTFLEFNQDLTGTNPLNFPGYEEKLSKLRVFTNQKEAIITGECEIEGLPCVLAVMDGFFMMGSMGAAVGEKFTLAAEKALDKKVPLIAFTVSGGARMQEGLVSLMQMSKTAAVAAKMDEAKIPYFVVLTDPTTGGVTASFAMLGDVTIAEPYALIGFAGRRVIEQTVKQVLPEDFQKAEFLLEKGFVDMIVHRSQLKETLAKLIKIHGGGAK